MRLEGIKHALQSSHIDNFNHDWNKMTQFDVNMHMFYCDIAHSKSTLKCPFTLQAKVESML